MEKVKKTIKKVLNILINLLIFLFIALLCFSINCKVKNIPTIMFGKTYIKLASNSMEKSNFKSGDLIITKLINPNQLKIGDKIAFYLTTENPPSELQNSNHSSGINYNFLQHFGIDCKTFEKVGRTQPIIFHEIVDIKSDSNNELWFQTWGTSNVYANGTPIIDANWTNQKYIIGIYQGKSIFNNMGKIFKEPTSLYFATTSILILISTFNLILTLNKLLYIKKLKTRKILITNKRIKPYIFKCLTISEKADIINSIKSNEMLEFKNKAFSYINTKS